MPKKIEVIRAYECPLCSADYETKTEAKDCCTYLCPCNGPISIMIGIPEREKIACDVCGKDLTLTEESSKKVFTSIKEILKGQ